MKEDIFDYIMHQEKKAKQFGFYWESLEQLIAQITSECLEIKEAVEHSGREHLKEEVGDLMNAAVSLAIFLNFNPHEVLKDSAEKFQERYERLVDLVKQDGLSNLQDQPMAVLMHYWNKAKIR